MTTSNFEDLRDAVVGASHRRSWADAVGEWEVIGLEEDPSGSGICICGQLGLVKLFTIRNNESHNDLYPIGSSCINHFGRSDLNQDVATLTALAKLRSSFQRRDQITLTGDYFSRALLEYFYDQGVFPDSKWNNNNGWNDYDFLLTMFNKHLRDEVTKKQQSKIFVLLAKVRFFVMSDTWAGA
jgi:hypothetical protein